MASQADFEVISYSVRVRPGRAAGRGDAHVNQKRLASRLSRFEPPNRLAGVIDCTQQDIRASGPQEELMSTTTRFWRVALVAAFTCTGQAAVAGDCGQRIVEVTGQGEVSAAPDLARVTLGVEARKPTLAAARAEVTATVERVLSLTKSLKIDPKLVTATQVQVQPEYNWNERDRKQVLLGYVVSRQVEVELRDLEQLGVLFERAADAGVNQVSGAQLDSSHRKDLEREAMARAVQDARLNAEVLATAAGVKLGTVCTLNGDSNAPPMPMYRRGPMMAMEDAAAAPPPPEASYQAGDLKFSATVRAQFALTGAP
jgi:uncharacterized protein YggE